ncbi:hypothetical protein GQX74_006578 [Glossina fuscipes]|nr:hypothetical protein GQX74_006578 [Glossina fuscipes]
MNECSDLNWYNSSPLILNFVSLTYFVAHYGELEKEPILRKFSLIKSMLLLQRNVEILIKPQLSYGPNCGSDGGNGYRCAFIFINGGEDNVHMLYFDKQKRLSSH